MSFLKNNYRLLLISVLVSLVSLEFEMRVFRMEFPLVSILILLFSVLIILQISLISKLKEVTINRFNELKQLLAHQEKINRNLMFAIEEIIDLQRQNNK